MKWLELKIPPLVVLIFFAAIAFFIEGRVSSLFVAARALIGLILVGLGSSFLLAAVAGFRKLNTTVNPLEPAASTVLKIDGVYRYSRNPMYVGFALWLAAWCVWLGGFWSWLMLPLYIIYLNHFQILPEEKVLGEKFGQQFIDYQSVVRRWL